MFSWFILSLNGKKKLCVQTWAHLENIDLAQLTKLIICGLKIVSCNRNLLVPLRALVHVDDRGVDRGNEKM